MAVASSARPVFVSRTLAQVTNRSTVSYDGQRCIKINGTSVMTDKGAVIKLTAATMVKVLQK